MVYLSTAYLAPIQHYVKLFQYEKACVYKEVHENYVKQTYRNRCVIAAAGGVLPLSIPIEKPQTLKCLTKDVRISDHGNWQHLHWNALISAYNMSPFFEYYEDDFAPFYEKKYAFLFDLNEELEHLICELLNLHPQTSYTSDFQAELPNDYRYTIRPKQPPMDLTFSPKPYYQVFQGKHGFLPNLSIVDLLFNMGPESLLVLRDSVLKPNT